MGAQSHVARRSICTEMHHTEGLEQQVYSTGGGGDKPARMSL